MNDCAKLCWKWRIFLGLYSNTKIFFKHNSWNKHFVKLSRLDNAVTSVGTEPQVLKRDTTDRLFLLVVSWKLLIIMKIHMISHRTYLWLKHHITQKMSFRNSWIVLELLNIAILYDSALKMHQMDKSRRIRWFIPSRHLCACPQLPVV